MIALDYQLSPSWNRKTEEVDLASVDESALRYEVILGDVILKVNEQDFSAKWGWVPIVDFATSLKQIASELAESDDGETTFEFTESNAALRFKRRADDVLVSASFAPGIANVPLSEFATAVDTFVGRVARELREQYPLLRENRAFAWLLPTN